MDPLQWFEITKEALTLAESELDASQLEFMILIQLNTDIKTFSTSKKEKDIKNSALLGQAWHCLVSILTNELQLEAWNSITIKSHNNAVIMYSLGLDVFLLTLSDTTLDPLDILKIILKFIFHVGYQKKYETIGLVSSEGFPVWVSSAKEMDEFLFAISITSLLSLVERIDMEVGAGGVDACILQGTENLLLNVAFNPSQDLALAVTQQGSDLSDISLDSELNSLYQKIADPVIFSAIVPEITDEDRERMLEEIRQAYEGETTEEEIQTLSAFDTEMLDSLENEIKAVAKKYGAKEISIGYLRKRMKLPAEVLSMALQYLIGEGSIEGRIGTERKTGSEILVLNLISDIDEDEKNALDMVQKQINDLFIPLNDHLSQIPEIHLPKTVTQEVITGALGEFQIMIILSDTDPLFMLANDLRIVGAQLEGSVKTLGLVKKQLSETDPDDVLRNELERRYANLNEKISEQRLTIVGKVTRFHEDLLNSYRLLFRLLPPPAKFNRSKKRKKVVISFTCPANNCKKTVQIRDDPSTWVKLGVFAILLGIQEDFPEKPPSFVTRIRNSIENRIKKLINLTEETEKEVNIDLENYSFLENLDKLLITNVQRDDAINMLRQVRVEQGIDKEDFYSLFAQCNSCNRWYCKNHMSTDNKCRYC